MIKCKKCNEDNTNYNNYCSHDGELLEEFQIDFFIEENSNNYCDECGGKIDKKQSYCPNCGKLLNDIDVYDKKIKIENKEKLENDFEEIFDKNAVKNIKYQIKNFKYIEFLKENYKYALLTILIALIFSSVLAGIYQTVEISDLEWQDILYEMLGSYKLKVFLANLVGMNAPSVNMSMISAFTNEYMTLFIAIRNIINPIIIGMFMYISVSLVFKNKKVKTLPMTIFCSVVYTVIMSIIGIFVSVNEFVEGYRILISVSFISLIVNSFIISFVGIYFALEKNNIVVKFAKKSVLTILISIVVLQLVSMFIYEFKIVNSNYFNGSFLYNLEQIPEIISELGFYGIDKVFIVILAIISLDIWILSFMYIMLHLIPINLFGMVSLNLFSCKDIIGHNIFGLILIPIIVLIIQGGFIKRKYGEGKQKMVILFSGIYSITMFLLSYFSKILIRGDHETISWIVSTIMGNMSNIYLENTLYIGCNGFLVIIGTFVFSLIFTYIGYKISKKTIN